MEELKKQVEAPSLFAISSNLHEYLQRFIRFGAAKWVIEEIENVSSYSCGKLSREKYQPHGMHVVWLVLPFHPIWAGKVKELVGRVVHRHRHRQ